MTRQHSIVQHKTNYFYLMLEDDYIALYEHIAQQVDPQKEQENKKLSGPSDCKAMIASVLEHWMNSKRATARCEEDLYVYMTYEEWEQALRYRYKRSTIIQCLKEMECEGAWKDEEGKYGEPGMEYRGTVKKRHFVQNTYQYVLHLPVVQGMLTQLPEQSPFEQKPRPSLGRPSKNRSNKNDIKINGLILDDGSVKTNDGSVKTNAPFYTQITTQTDHTSESMYDTYASVMPASAEHDAHTPSQSENENHSHQEQVTPNTSYSQQSNQSDNKKEEGQNGHNAIRLHGGATPSGSDVLSTPVEFPTPVNQQTTSINQQTTHSDSATIEQPQQQEVTPQVELPAQPQEQATLLDVPSHEPEMSPTNGKVMYTSLGAWEEARDEYTRMVSEQWKTFTSAQKGLYSSYSVYKKQLLTSWGKTHIKPKQQTPSSPSHRLQCEPALMERINNFYDALDKFLQQGTDDPKARVSRNVREDTAIVDFLKELDARKEPPTPPKVRKVWVSMWNEKDNKTGDYFWRKIMYPHNVCKQYMLRLYAMNGKDMKPEQDETGKPSSPAMQAGYTDYTPKAGETFKPLKRLSTERKRA